MRIGMGDVRRQDDGVVLIGDGGQPGSPGRSRAWGTAVYSVCSGALGTVAGAAASLVVPAVARVAVWCGVAGAVCIGAGLTWHSGRVSAWREAFSRWLAALSSS